MRHLTVNQARSWFRVSARATLMDIKMDCPALQGELRGDENELTTTGSMELLADMRQLKSGQRLLDWKLKHYVEVERYPQARFTLERISVADKLDSAPEELCYRIELTGTIHWRDCQVPVSAQAQGTLKDGHLTANGSTALTISAFNLKPKKILFLEVKNDLTVDVHIEATER